VKLLDDYFNIKPLVVTAGVKTGVRIPGITPVKSALTAL